MKNIEKAFNLVKEEFNSIWSHTLKGETLVITTPFCTPNGTFIKIYLTKKNKEYIITDADMLGDNEYCNSKVFLSKCSQKYFDDIFRIFFVQKHDTGMFYSKTDDINLVGSRVFDLIQFINFVISDCGEKHG